MSVNSIHSLSKSPIRSVSKQFTALSNLNIKLKMYDLGKIGMIGKGGDFYYYYMDDNNRSKTKTRTTLKGIMKYASGLLLQEKEAENHGD